MLLHDMFTESFHKFFPKKTEDVQEDIEQKRNLIRDMFFNPQPEFEHRFFKAHTLCSHSFKAWTGTNKILSDFNHHLKEAELKIETADKTLEDCFCEMFPTMGIRLAAPVEKMELAGIAVYSADKGALLISLERQLSNEALNAMIEQAPDLILCLD
ncbi:MAG: hypothetical protein V4525_12405 [Pseudomonadota bacterium]